MKNRIHQMLESVERDVAPKYGVRQKSVRNKKRPEIETETGGVRSDFSQSAYQSPRQPDLWRRGSYGQTQGERWPLGEGSAPSHMFRGKDPLIDPVRAAMAIFRGSEPGMGAAEKADIVASDIVRSAKRDRQNGGKAGRRSKTELDLNSIFDQSPGAISGEFSDSALSRRKFGLFSRKSKKR